MVHLNAEWLLPPTERSTKRAWPDEKPNGSYWVFCFSSRRILLQSSRFPHGISGYEQGSGAVARPICVRAWPAGVVWVTPVLDARDPEHQHPILNLLSPPSAYPGRSVALLIITFPISFPPSAFPFFLFSLQPGFNF